MIDRKRRYGHSFCLIAVLTALLATSVPSPAETAERTEYCRPKYVRTLAAPNELAVYGMFQSGTFRLAWSPDGQRLAAYIRHGTAIMIWSPDGKHQREFPRYTRFGLDADVLGFVSGHSQLVISPSAIKPDIGDKEKLEETSFSVMDSTTGKVVQEISGRHPGKTFRENIVRYFAISQDQKVIAVSYHPYAGPIVDIYSTENWQRIASINSQNSKATFAQALNFSPDGSKLAVAYGHTNHVDVFDARSWKLLRSIQPFPKPPPPMHVLALGAVVFNSDGTMIAISSRSGGVSLRNSDGSKFVPGGGELIEEFPSKPLRVFDLRDGSLVAEVGGFPGGISDNRRLAWTPSGSFIAFLDIERHLRFWNPMKASNSVVALKLKSNVGGFLFSPDGTQIATNAINGIEIFDCIPSESAN